MSKKASTTTPGTLKVHSKDKKDSQTDVADKKSHYTEEIPKTNSSALSLGRVRRSAKWTGKWLWRTTLFLGFWLGIVSGYAGLLQRVSVSQNDQLDPNDTFSSPFIVSNDGPLPIENVQFRCGIGHAAYEHGPEIRGGENFGSSFIFMPDASGNLPSQNFGAGEMNPGERSTIPSCSYPFPKNVASADIGIIASFRIGYTPFKTTRIFRFVTLPDSKKQLHWFPYPLK